MLLATPTTPLRLQSTVSLRSTAFRAAARDNFHPPPPIRTAPRCPIGAPHISYFLFYPSVQNKILSCRAIGIRSRGKLNIAAPAPGRASPGVLT